MLRQRHVPPYGLGARAPATAGLERRGQDSHGQKSSPTNPNYGEIVEKRQFSCVINGLPGKLTAACCTSIGYLRYRFNPTHLGKNMPKVIAVCIGSFPPPVQGAAIINQKLREQLQGQGILVKTIDLSPGGRRGFG